MELTKEMQPRALVDIHMGWTHRQSYSCAYIVWLVRSTRLKGAIGRPGFKTNPAPLWRLHKPRAYRAHPMRILTAWLLLVERQYLKSEETLVGLISIPCF